MAGVDHRLQPARAIAAAFRTARRQADTTRTNYSRRYANRPVPPGRAVAAGRAPRRHRALVPPTASTHSKVVARFLAVLGAVPRVRGLLRPGRASGGPLRDLDRNGRRQRARRRDDYERDETRRGRGCRPHDGARGHPAVVDEPVEEITLAQVLERPTESRSGPPCGSCRRATPPPGGGFDLERGRRRMAPLHPRRVRSLVERFVRDGQQARLTQAALEALAVVAYRQPVSRARVAAIRGVNSDGVMRTLAARGLASRRPGPTRRARPCSTGPPAYFMERLGLRDLSELPELAPFLPDDDTLEEQPGEQANPVRVMDAVEAATPSARAAQQPRRRFRGPAKRGGSGSRDDRGGSAGRLGLPRRPGRRTTSAPATTAPPRGDRSYGSRDDRPQRSSRDDNSRSDRPYGDRPARNDGTGPSATGPPAATAPAVLRRPALRRRPPQRSLRRPALRRRPASAVLWRPPRRDDRPRSDRPYGDRPARDDRSRSTTTARPATTVPAPTAPTATVRSGPSAMAVPRATTGRVPTGPSAPTGPDRPPAATVRSRSYGSDRLQLVR